MCLSVGITFVARKRWPGASRKNMFVTTCAARHASVHVFTYLHRSVHAGSRPDSCVCV